MFSIFKLLKLYKRRHIIKKSGLFDEIYYLKLYPDVRAADIDPIEHYILFGAKERRNPNIYFQTGFYLDKYPDIVQSGINPLLHYILFGVKEGRWPNPEFDKEYYLLANTDVKKARLNPLLHYILFGQQEGRKTTSDNVERSFLIHKSDLADKESSLQASEIEKTNLNGQLSEIHRPLGYRALLKYYKFRDALLPANTRRRKILKFITKDSIYLLKKSINYVKKYGLGAFLRKVKEKIQHGKYFIPKQDLVLFENNLNNIPVEIIFKKNKNPKVSIIIPTYNKFDYTYNCLKSIYKNTDIDQIEIIVVDDASSDETINIKKYIKNIEVIKNEKSLGFIKSCNKASQFANGRYLLFLNNDTQVQQDWLKFLLEVIEKDNKVALVGPKFVYPDGRLQEAGGIIWNDATGWNYGRFDEPEKPEYNYLKEADYISGACILVRKELWNNIGGFDERYSPAYFEDSDLAFEIRKRGYKVIYQPKSVVVHFEGVSNGTDTSSGIKQYQEINRVKFLNKWKEILEKEHFSNGQDAFLSRDRSKNKPHILVIDHYVPHFDQDAGSRTIFTWLKVFNDLGFNVTFIGDNFFKHEPYTSVLQQLGIEVIYGNYYANNWRDYLKNNLNYFNYALLSRSHISEKYLEFILLIKKQYNLNNPKTIYYPHDLTFLRLFREYDVTGNKDILEEAKYIQEKEYSLFNKTDAVLLPSLVEKEIVAKKLPGKEIFVVPPFSYEVNFPQSKNDDFNERKGLLFVGGFQHRPNYYGIKWFIEKEVWKNIKRKINDIEFFIVGSKIPGDIKALEQQDKQIKVLGYLSDEELDSLYNKIRIVVVPLTFGAGIKGKIIEAIAMGIPIVTTSIGAEGIESAKTCMFIADTPVEFANAVSKIYSDKVLLEQFRSNQINYAKQYLSFERSKYSWSELLQYKNFGGS